MQFSKFAIDENPWCLWDVDLKQNNLHFLNSIDPEFFEYLSKAYVKSNTSDDENNKIALALRMTYSQGLETFFAFLFAAIQAPDCPLGWLHKYWPSDIESLLNKIHNRQPVLSKLDIIPFTWQNIADKILIYFTINDKDKERRLKQGFASTWEHFAEDFLEPSFRPEYNSIKHELQVGSGGFKIQAGREITPGVPVPATHLLAKTEYGSKFYTVEALDAEAADKSRRQLLLTQHFRSWQPEKFHLGIYLISLSLQNVLSFLKIISGAEPSHVQFSWPSDETHFTAPWVTNINSSGMGLDIGAMPMQITPFTKEQILSVYKENLEENHKKS